MVGGGCFHQALWSVGCDPVGNCYETIQEGNGFLVLLQDAEGLSEEDMTYLQRLERFAKSEGKDCLEPCIANSWRGVTGCFGLDTDTTMWGWLCAQGPPVAYAEDPVQTWGQVVQRNIKAAQKKASKKAAAVSVASSSPRPPVGWYLRFVNH